MRVQMEVADLVERFERNADEYRGGQLHETRLHDEIIAPFFKCLGWELNGPKRDTPSVQGDVPVDRLSTLPQGGARDYSFSVHGVRKFFLKTTTPSPAARDDPAPALQLRRFGWSANLAISLLTDFEQLAVYNCRSRPSPSDDSSAARIDRFYYKEYLNRWDELVDRFSFDGVLQGALDKYAESTSKPQKGRTTVDAVFLKDINAWRKILARNVSELNPQLTSGELNLAIQLILDRIVFLRICEDRGLEPFGQLKRLLDHRELFKSLVKLFRKAERRYRSGLFYFTPQKGRTESPDALTQKLVIDDAPLREIVGCLYYPNSPYEFSVMPAEILGQVYEQYLGKVIRLTSTGRSVLEDRPDTKRAGGIYYTPANVVNHVVKQTVGSLLNGKTPRDARRLRILDPACGSGSFLLSAFQYLLDWYRSQYLAAGCSRHSAQLYRAPNGGWRLTIGEKKRILAQNLFGVDIDPQAVEVTKLSLLLKILEGENSDTLA